MKWVIASENKIESSGGIITAAATGEAMLAEIYRGRINDYPKFFKMDILCKLGFIASELLLLEEGFQRFKPREDRAVILFNSTGSIDADKSYQATINNKDDYFPSPSLFVYTLPNIVTGEIAIRNNYFCETSFYVIDSFSAETMARICVSALEDKKIESIVGGWLDCTDKNHFLGMMFLADRGDMENEQTFIRQIKEISHCIQ